MIRCSANRRVLPRSPPGSSADSPRAEAPGELDQHRHGLTTTHPLITSHEKGATDGTDVVHGPLELVGLPVGARVNDVGQQCVCVQGRAGRRAVTPPRSPTCQTASPPPCPQRVRPWRRSRRPRLPGAGRGHASAPPPKRARRDRRSPLDEAKLGRRRAQRRSEQARQQRRWYLMADVSEQPRLANPCDT